MHSLFALLPAFCTLTASATTGLQAGRLNEFNVELPDGIREIAGRGRASPVRHALVTIAVPENFDVARDWPVMVICATSDPGYNSSRGWLRQYAAAAMERGWILVAADPAENPGQDDLALRYALDLSALAVLKLSWPGADKVPLAFGGFSGGAKCSGRLAAAFAGNGRRILGIYLAGINEDTIVSSAREFNVLNESYRNIPVFLQSGESDPIATPDDHRAVRDKLKRAGFGNVRIEYFHGAHEVDTRPFRDALDWFRDLYPSMIFRANASR